MAAEAASQQSMLDQVHHALNVYGFNDPVYIAGLGNVNFNTIAMTWVVMLLVILFTVPATRNMKLDRPGKLQLLVEEAFQFLKGLVNENMDPRKGASIICLVFALFLYLLFSNLWGLVPTMMSPTADINTTLGMALFVIVLIQFLAIKYKGAGGYFKHFFQPYFFFLPLVIIEELSKPITLSFRLYGNIYAGEVLIAVLLGLIPLGADLLGGFLASILWLAFSIFVGFLQAFIFTMLTIAYTSQAVSEEH